MDPFTAAIVKKSTSLVLSSGAKALLRRLPTAQRKLDRAAKEIERDLLYDVAEQMDRVARRLGLLEEKAAEDATATMTEPFPVHDGGRRAAHAARWKSPPEKNEE